MYSKDVNTVLMDYKTSAKTGLGAKEAVNRLSEYGYNELPHGKKESIFHKFVMQLKDFMIYTLVVAAAISFGAAGNNIIYHNNEWCHRCYTGSEGRAFIKCPEKNVCSQGKGLKKWQMV